MDETVRTQISDLIANNKVVLFMKGTRNFPQCGFSATVVQILNELTPTYHTVNVLKESDIRQAIKEFSSWPTIPQLYVGGEFVGGCDIVREMYVSGELQEKLGVEDKATPPKIEITPAAREALAQAGQGGEGKLRLGVSTRFEYELALDDPQKGDFEIDAGGITVLVDRMSAQRADGIRIDYTATGGGGFKIDNPNEPARVKPLRPSELKAMLDAGESFELVDVRTPQEQSAARIGKARLLDPDYENDLGARDKGAPLVFFCHHGGRSRAAAERFVAEGHTKVFNLEGGIDAWSREVDDTVPRY
ncbi:MAG TPA: Grx4 family monothiol glutaredoxin [Polyangiales bacterium]|nr:Grx4 family monothiol glutaredoxin [Polyangiales bacterium]